MTTADIIQALLLLAFVLGGFGWFTMKFAALSTTIGVLSEAVDRLDKELRGNGSIPPRCAKHAQELELFKQQLAAGE